MAPGPPRGGRLPTRLGRGWMLQRLCSFLPWSLARRSEDLVKARCFRREAAVLPRRRSAGVGGRVSPKRGGSIRRAVPPGRRTVRPDEAARLGALASVRSPGGRGRSDRSGALLARVVDDAATGCAQLQSADQATAVRTRNAARCSLSVRSPDALRRHRGLVRRTALDCHAETHRRLGQSSPWLGQPLAARNDPAAHPQPRCLPGRRPRRTLRPGTPILPP